METHSPCNGICQVDGANRLCLGCFRYLFEIASWSTFTEMEREMILKSIEDRKGQLILE